MPVSKSTLLVSLALGLAACGSDGAGNDAVSNSAIDMNATQAPANAFGDAEAGMNQAMMSTVGTDVGDNWAKKMIAHHQGAIDMSQAVLARSPSADVAKMAREDIGKQQKDIDSIRKLLKGGQPDQKSAGLYTPAMMAMQQKMDAVSGSDINQVFMRKMLAHHNGAVAMSDVALHNGVSGALKAQVEKTRAENQKDAAMVEAMLGGKSMAEAKDMSSPGATASGMNMPEDMNGMDMNGMNHM